MSIFQRTKVKSCLISSSLSMTLIPTAPTQESSHWVHQSQITVPPSTDTGGRNSLWVEEAWLEGQDAELNSTAPGNRTCVKREPDGRWWHLPEAQLPLEAALPALGKSQGQEQSPSMPPRCCSHTSSGGKCSNGTGPST